MFCPKCGNKLVDNTSFCGNCGEKIVINETLTEKMARKNPIKPLLGKLKKFIIKHKKKLAIITVCLLVIIVGISLFYKFYDFTKLKWDSEYKDYDIHYTSGGEISLKVIALDKEGNNIDDIEFSVDGGKFSAEANEVVWTVPTKEGKYVIKAKAPSGKTISKEISVVDANVNKDLAGLEPREETDNNGDSDKDGLLDTKEKELGTNIKKIDTDSDGLGDYYEVNVSKTDPLKNDSDSDGLFDGDELDLGLDPLKEDSKGDGIKDGSRSVSFTVSDKKSNVTLQVNGSGNIASTTVDAFSNTTLSNIDGLINTVYNLYTPGKLEKAKITIKYDVNVVKKLGLNEEKLVLYYFDDETKELEAVTSTINTKTHELTAELNHFSKYVIGDSTKVIGDIETDIMLLIDDSISMYNEKQVLDYGYTSCTGCDGNDTTFKRVELSNKLVDRFTGNYKFGVGTIKGTYTNLLDLTSDKVEVKKVISSIQSDSYKAINGTNIVSALENGIDKFDDEKNNKFIILLTDGQNTVGSLSVKKDSIIESAKNQDIKICVIGLGSKLDVEDLTEIATETGCGYYHASNDKALDEIYSKLSASINYNYVDTDGDNEVDGMITYDSGFITNRDGFSFANFGTNLSSDGHCYGMATFAMKYYMKDLPESLNEVDSFSLLYKGNFNIKARGYDLSDTYFFDDGKISNNNLYNYTIADEELSLYLNGYPSDYWSDVKDELLMINSEYRTKLANIGADFSEVNYNGDDKEFKKYQTALLNVDSDKYRSNVDSESVNLLDAIYRLFVLQHDDERSSFTSAPDASYELLISNLEKGIPMVLGVDGNHAINGLRLIIDNDDSNKFKIEVYDNNYPGEVRYINGSRSKFNKIQLNYTVWTNEYEYSFEYENKEVSLGIHTLKNLH